MAYALRDCTDRIEEGTLVPQECLRSCRPIRSPHLLGTQGTSSSTHNPCTATEQQSIQQMCPGAALHPSWWASWVSRCPHVGPASQSRLTQPASIRRGTLGTQIPSLCLEDAVHIVFVKDFRIHSCRSRNPTAETRPAHPPGAVAALVRWKC